MKYFLILLGLVISLGMKAQEHYLDSLENALEKYTKNQPEYIDILNLLARDYAYVSAKRAVGYAEEALQQSLESNYKHGEAYAYRNLAFSYLLQEYLYSGTEFLEKAMALFESMNDSIGLANCHITLGNNFRRQGNYKEALHYDQKALKILEKSNQENRKAIIYHNIAYNYALIGDSELALEFANRSLSLAIVQKNLILESSCYRVLGIAYFERNNFEKASEYFQQVLKLSEQLGPDAQKEAMIEAFFHLALIAQRSGNTIELNYLQYAIETAKQYGYPYLVRKAYIKVVDYYLVRGNAFEARKYLNQYQSAQDSLQSVQQNDRAFLMQSAINLMRLKSENEKLIIQQAIDEQRLISQQNRILAFSIGLISVFIFLLLLLRNSRQRRTLNHELVLQKMKVEEKSAKLEKLNHSKDTFFNIVSHDIKSPLNSLKGVITLLKNNRKHLSEPEIDHLLHDIDSSLHNTLNLTDNITRWAQSQMNRLDIQLKEFDLCEVINPSIQLYKDDLERKEITLSTHLAEPLLVLADQPSVEFIIRNLINNAVKFTRAKGEIKISAHRINHYVEFSIFNTTEAINPKQLNSIFELNKNKSTLGTEGERGTGLGLSIAKDYAERNQASLYAKNEAEGVVFTLRI